VLGNVPHVGAAALRHTLLLVLLASEHIQAQCLMRHNIHQMASQYPVEPKPVQWSVMFSIVQGLIALGRPVKINIILQ
jgi:hypothetical protein